MVPLSRLVYEYLRLSLHSLHVRLSSLQVLDEAKAQTGYGGGSE